MGHQSDEKAVGSCYSVARNTLIGRGRMDYEYAPFADTDSLVSDG